MYSTYCTVQYTYMGEKTAQWRDTLGTGTDRERDRKNKESSRTTVKKDKRENKERVYRKDREAEVERRLYREGERWKEDYAENGREGRRDVKKTYVDWEKKLFQKGRDRKRNRPRGKHRKNNRHDYRR